MDLVRRLLRTDVTQERAAGIRPTVQATASRCQDPA
jgi:hypothetical protein